MTKKVLIITEKPSAAKNFATALGGQNGIIKDGILAGSTYQIINLIGHIFEAPMPEERAFAPYKETVGSFANIKNIPWSYTYFDFEKRLLKKEMRKGQKDMYKEIFNSAHSYLKNGYIPLIATDIDPTGEGDLVAWELLLGLNYKGPVYREYHTDETPKEILKSIKNAKLIDSTDGSFQMAVARSNMDYMTMQLTRLSTILLSNKGIRIMYNQLPIPIPMGRLKSVILTLLGDQIKAINEYKPSSLYESRYKLENLTLSNPDVTKFKTKEEWHNEGLPLQAKVKLHKQIPGSTKPPKALTLSQLSGLMNKDGLSVKKTLDLYQKMYDDSVLTYPRTEDNFITPEQFKEMLPYIDTYINLLGLPVEIFTHRQPRPTHVKEGGSHGALRPGMVIPKRLADLDDKYGKGASKIYKIVTEKFLMMFLEDTEWIKYEYHTETTPVFKGVLKVITKQGVPDDDKDGLVTKLPDLTKLAELYPHEVKSKKPTAPTTQWLLNQLEKHSVGTPATQPQTVSDMTGTTDASPIKDGKVLSLTFLGECGYKAAKATVIGSIEGTKVLHDLIKYVKKSKNPIEAYKEFEKIIISDTERLREMSWTNDINGGEKYQVAEYVTGTWKGEDIKFKATFSNHKFTQEEIQALLNDEEITIEITTKAGNKANMKGKLARQEYNGREYVGFKGEFIRDESEYAFGIWNGQQIKFKKKYGSYIFSQDEINILLSGQPITISTMFNDSVVHVTGRLAEQEFKGYKYIGFKKDADPDRASGVWNGKQISFKKVFMGYTFSDSEIEQLLNGDRISIMGTKKDGTQTVVHGRLALQTFKGHEFVGFKAEFDNNN